MKKQFARVFSLMMISFFALGSVSGADQLTMQEGANINLSVAENGGNSTITISSTDTNTDEKVKVSSSDTADYLESQIVGGAGVTVNSDGSQITISAPPVNVEDSADGVEVTVAKQGEYDPGTGFVPVLDLNGTALVSTGINPTVTIGGINASLLATSENPQQIIAGIPSGFATGNYKLKVENNDTNSPGFSEGLVYLNNLIGGNDAGTVLLLHGDGTGSTLVDSSASNHTITTSGGAAQSTAQSQFGGSSMYFDGIDDHFSVGDTSTFKFLHGAESPTNFKYTIDTWVKLEKIGDHKILVGTTESASAHTGANLAISVNEAISFEIRRGVPGTAVVAFGTAANIISNDGLWHHIAVTYDQSLANGNAKIYLDGLLVATGNKTGLTPNTANSTDELRVGPNHIFRFKGYIDELRISKDVIRYNENFTPPAAPYN